MGTDETTTSSPATTLLLNHWSDLVRTLGRLPGTRDLDLHALRFILPQLWLVGVESGPLRFKVRLVGEVVRTAATGDLRPGVYVEEIGTRAGSRLFVDRLDHLVRSKTPDHFVGPPTANHLPEAMQIERLSVPLATDGETVDRILTCTAYSWPKGTHPWLAFDGP